MRLSLPAMLPVLAGGAILTDLVWWRLGHFDVSPVYAGSVALGLALAAAGLFYRLRRGEPRLAAMLEGAAFLVVFSAAASMLNSFLLTVAGPNSDAFFDRLDRALGFHWYDAMLAVAHHPGLNLFFFVAYNLVLPQIALLVVALAIWGRVENVYRFCAALALGALTTIAVWTVAPAFGAMALYILPPDIHPILSMTGETGRAQIALLQSGPGRIVPDVLHGSLIGFPSYHCVLALLVGFYGWELKALRWPFLLLNAVIVISTPIQGGHHLVDVLAAFPVAALAIALTRSFAMKSAGMVNQTSKFTIRPVPQGLFRIIAEQSDVAAPAPIKSKLSGVS